MISLPGLFLVTGRIEEAKQLLLRFAALMRDGLLPSEMAEDASGNRYEAADVSLWFIHAVGEYLRYRGDELVVQRDLLPAMQQIIDAYQRGTGLGIGVAKDGLLKCGIAGIPVTWMDARLGDWVITPRRGVMTQSPTCASIQVTGMLGTPDFSRPSWAALMPRPAPR